MTNVMREYYIELKMGIVFEGAEVPDEETLIMPIKKFIKEHLKAYKKTTRIVVIDTEVCESGYGDDSEEETQ